MALSLNNIVKGQITQTLLSILLERGGYRVTRLGVEELFGEIKYLDQSKYLDLKLPLQLRSLPDLLVADPGVTKAYLVEVKYRVKFNARVAAELYDTIKKQQFYWENTSIVLMISKPQHENGNSHQDYIRVITPDQTDRLNKTEIGPDEIWDDLPTIYDVFTLLDGRKSHEANAFTRLLTILSTLNVPDTLPVPLQALGNNTLPVGAEKPAQTLQVPQWAKYKADASQG